MLHLGETGKNINSDIKSLVSKGLPVQIQQALDYVRVVGNNAVHPGQMNFDDTSQTVNALFELVNLVIENQISQPKRIGSLFGSLPEGAQEAIKKRDDKPHPK